MKKILQKNWFFFILLLGMAAVFAKRYIYLPTDVVSHPDSQIRFSTQDGVLEQTWQPTVKVITGIDMPYYAEDDFSCDVQLKIFSDDYSKVLVEKVQEDYLFSAGQSGNIIFPFERISIIQGERYRIQIALLNASDDGVLQISSGSNYSGCSISGEEVGQAAALTVTVAKYSRLFWLVATLLPLLTYSFLAMMLTGKKWEETVGFSVFLEGILLYCFGWFEHLVLGISIVYLLAIISLIIGICLYNKKNLLLRDLLSPGLWIYMVMFGIIILSSNGDWLGYRDELRHWGIAARDMFFFDSFAKHADSTVILTRYLPFTALIEYAFEFMNGMFSEDILFIAYQTMVLSVLCILCKPLQRKDWKKLLIPILVTMVCVPVIFFNNISGSIMVDSLMAAIVAYTLICYYSDEMTWFNRIRIVSALTALTLIKDMGLIFAGMVALIMFGDILIRQIRMKKLGMKELFYPVFCVILVLIVYLSWQIYLNIPVKNSSESALQETVVSETAAPEENRVSVKEEETVSTAISASGITWDGLVRVLTGEGEPYQYQVTRNFIIELFEGDTYSFGTVSFPFIALLAMISFLIISLGYFGYFQMDKGRMYVFVALVWLAGIFLCAFLQVTYWFSFPIYDALDLTSFARYLAPYICAIVMVTFYLIYDGLQYTPKDSKKEMYLVYVLAFIFAVSMPVTGIVVEGKDIEGNTTDEITYGHSQIAEILRSVAGKGERAYFICSNSDGYSEYVFRNAICPIVSEHENWNIVSTQEAYEEQYALYGREQVDDNAAVILSVEAWKKELQDCQYVVVFHADELFRKSYAEVFGKMEAIDDGSIYQVIHEEGDISLQMIGQTGIKSWH